MEPTASRIESVEARPATRAGREAATPKSQRMVQQRTSDLGIWAGQLPPDSNFKQELSYQGEAKAWHSKEGLAEPSDSRVGMGRYMGSKLEEGSHPGSCPTSWHGMGLELSGAGLLQLWVQLQQFLHLFCCDARMGVLRSPPCPDPTPTDMNFDLTRSASIGRLGRLQLQLCKEPTRMDGESGIGVLVRRRRNNWVQPDPRQRHSGKVSGQVSLLSPLLLQGTGRCTYED